MDYEYSKDGVSSLLEDLIKYDKITISYIAKILGVSRMTVYSYMKQKTNMKRYNFEKLKELRGSSVDDVNLYKYFVEKLYQFNPLSKIPDSKTEPELQRVWIASLKALNARINTTKTTVDIRRLIDFAMSSYCPIIVTNPITLNSKAADIFGEYRKFIANNKTGSKSKKDIAEEVATRFLDEFKKFYRKDSMVTTEDSLLAHAVERIGGCQKISMMNHQQAHNELKFTYMELLKNPRVTKKQLIRNGNPNTSINLKEFR